MTTDKFGRPTQSLVDGITTYTTYNGLGRVKTVSNPGLQNEVTTTSYDTLGRVIGTLHPDGSTDSIQYWGERILFTDAAAKKRLQISDALGRLIQVVEDPTTGVDVAPTCPAGDMITQNLCAIYTYNVLDNLRTVTQGSQTRTFEYNSLSQLLWVKNPEVNQEVSCSGDNVSTCYAYDANGNVLTQAAPGVTTTFGYDDLDRVQTKSYDDTPQSTYLYDTVKAGCLTSVTNSVSIMAYTYGPGTHIRPAQSATPTSASFPIQQKLTHISLPAFCV